jgi:hypothetical protein
MDRNHKESNTPSIYYYTDGSCGTGKTHHAIHNIMAYGGKHLFVVDRREVIAERKAMALSMACRETPVIIDYIASREDRTAMTRSVTAQIMDLPSRFEGCPHALVFITHEAMRLCDFSAFADWQIWIDEVPSILDQKTMRLRASAEMLAQSYKLVPVEGVESTNEWCELRLHEDCKYDLAKLAEDDLLSPLIPLHRRIMEAEAGRRTVITTTSDWSELTQRGASFNWFSIWSPEHLSTFAKVHFLANDFRNSLTYRIIRQVWTDIEWREVRINSGRVFERRRVFIHYYAEKHIARRTLFDSPVGVERLGAIAQDINSRVNRVDHIWSCNSGDEYKLPLIGERLSPKKAGSNSYSDRHAATMIYTAKADNHQRTVYRLLGLDPLYHCETNEREAIVQFMTRTSIRDPRSREDVHLFVYDHEQAEYLRDYFLRDDRQYVEPIVELRDLGFAHEVHDSKPGRKVPLLTAEEMEAKAAAKREAARIRMAKKRAEAKVLA